MKKTFLLIISLIFVLSSINLNAQTSFMEDGIRYEQVTNVRQLAQLSCDINPSASSWEELSLVIQNLLSGQVMDGITGCYGKRGNKKCKKSGGLCLKSTISLDDQTGEILRMIGGMVNEYGEYEDTPAEGRLFYGFDENRNLLLTFRNN